MVLSILCGIQKVKQMNVTKYVVSSGYMPKSEIAGPYHSSIFSI